MTHDESVCYKAKTPKLNPAVPESRKVEPGGHVKSYKGAVQSERKPYTAQTKGHQQIGTRKGTNRARGLPQKRQLRESLRGNEVKDDNSMAETTSLKKDKMVNENQDSGMMMSDNDLLSEDEKDPPSPTKEPSDVGMISSPQLQSNHVDEAAVKISQDLPAADMSDFHENVAKKLEEYRQIRFEKPPPGPSKPTSRPSTPLRGISMKKMAVVAAVNHTKTTKKGDVKIGKPNE